MTAEPFPWARAMALGLGHLRLSPDAFWRMTPREFAAALDAIAPAAGPPLERAALHALMQQFPD